jgi:hypothetical protein
MSQNLTFRCHAKSESGPETGLEDDRVGTVIADISDMTKFGSTRGTQIGAVGATQVQNARVGVDRLDFAHQCSRQSAQGDRV